MQYFEFKDPGMINLQALLAESPENQEALMGILTRLAECRSQTHCYSCGHEAECLALRGIIRFQLGEYNAALDELSEAYLHFYHQDDVWNQVICLMSLANARIHNHEEYAALQDLEKANSTLLLFARLHDTEYLPQIETIAEALRSRLDEIRRKMVGK